MILLLTVRLAVRLTVRLAVRLAVLLATRCEVRLSSVGPSAASSFGAVFGFFGSIFFSLISCLQVVRGVDDTQHHSRCLVCHPADTCCVNPPTFGIDDRMSATLDIWESLAAEVDGSVWKPELAAWVEVKRFEARGGLVYGMVANTRDLSYFRLDAVE